MNRENYWYYAIEGQSIGPLSENNISELIKNGQITEKTLLWRSGFEEWCNAENTELWGHIETNTRSIDFAIDSSQEKNGVEELTAHNTHITIDKVMSLLAETILVNQNERYNEILRRMDELAKENVEIKRYFAWFTELIKSIRDETYDEKELIHSEFQNILGKMESMREDLNEGSGVRTGKMLLGISELSKEIADLKKNVDELSESVFSFSSELAELQKTFNQRSKPFLARQDFSSLKFSRKTLNDQKTNKSQRAPIAHSNVPDQDIQSDVEGKSGISSSEKISYEHENKEIPTNDFRDAPQPILQTHRVQEKSPQDVARPLFTGTRVKDILVGIDFGSRYTKVLYRIIDGIKNKPLIHALDIGGNKCGCIIPSSVRISRKKEKDHESWYSDETGEDVKNLKTSLLKKTGIIDCEINDNLAFEQATFFFWSLFKIILNKLRRHHVNLAFEDIAFNVCVPVASDYERDAALIRLYEKILTSALKCAEMEPEYLKLEDLVQIKESRNEAELKYKQRISITPEAVAQVLPYINYMHGKQTGKHMIVDIGGGTIDFSIFELADDFKKVEFLNTHVHVGAMNIVETQLQKEEISPALYGEWTDTELKIIHEYFQRVREDPSIKKFIGGAYKKCKDTSEWEDVRVLLAGGGAYQDSPFHKDLCDIFGTPFWEGNAPVEKRGKKYEVIPYTALKLPNFDINECRGAISHIHRLLVAYGLCFKKDEYPDSIKPFGVSPKIYTRPPHIMDEIWREDYYL
jgi:hypothetical protein